MACDMASGLANPVYAGPERRSGADRRILSHLRADWRWIYKGRRRVGRRAEDHAHTDWYSPRLMVLVVCIFLLSALDAFMTLNLLRSGQVVEANPFMRLLLEHEVQVFVNVKTVLTGWGLIVLVACSNMRVLRKVRVRQLIVGLFGLYAALIGWEIYLLRATTAS